MKKYSILFLLAGIFLISCNKEAVVEEEETSPFEGKWTLTYSGDLQNSFVMTIREDGFAFGSALEPSRGNVPVALAGEVLENGTFEISGDQGGDFVEMEGTLIEAIGNGDWTLVNTGRGDNLSGTWTAVKL